MPGVVNVRWRRGRGLNEPSASPVKGWEGGGGKGKGLVGSVCVCLSVARVSQVCSVDMGVDEQGRERQGKRTVDCEHGSGVGFWDLGGFGFGWVRDMVWMEMEARKWREQGRVGPGGQGGERQRLEAPPAGQRQATCLPACLPSQPDYYHVPALRTVPDAQADRLVSNLAFLPVPLIT